MDKRKAPAGAGLLFLVLLVGLSTSGCAVVATGGVIGGAMGAAIRTTKVRQGTPTAATQLAIGQKVRLHLRDGQTISGRIESLYSRSVSEYARMYADFRARADAAATLPDLGPVQMVSGQFPEAPPDVARPNPELVELIGVESLGIVVRNKGLARPKFVPFDRVLSLTAGDKPVDVRALEKFAARGEVPSLTEIRLADPVQRVGLNEVTLIETSKRHTVKGIIVGLVLPAAVAVISCFTWLDCGQ